MLLATVRMLDNRGVLVSCDLPRLLEQAKKAEVGEPSAVRSALGDADKREVKRRVRDKEVLWLKAKDARDAR